MHFVAQVTKLILTTDLFFDHEPLSEITLHTHTQMDRQQQREQPNK